MLRKDVATAAAARPARPRAAPASKQPHTAQEPGQDAKLFLLAQLAPVTIVVNAITVTRLQRMMSRTASSFRSGAVSSRYMDRIKLVALARHFGLSSLGRMPSSPVGQLDAQHSSSSRKAGAVYVAAQAMGVSIVLPLLSMGEEAAAVFTSPETAATAHATSGVFNATLALTSATSRTFGPVFQSRLCPIGLTCSEGSWSADDSAVALQRLVITEIVLKNLILTSRDCRDTRVPLGLSTEPGSLSASEQHALTREWFDAAPSYESLHVEVATALIRTYHVETVLAGNTVAVQQLVQDPAKWAHGLRLLWCGELLSLQQVDVGLWSTRTPDQFRFPRSIFNISCPSVRINVMPGLILPIFALATSWKRIIASHQSSQEPSQKPMFGPDAARSIAGPLTRRAPSMRVLKTTSAVQLRVVAAIESVSISLFGRGTGLDALLPVPTVAPAAASAAAPAFLVHEHFQVRLGMLQLLYSKSQKAFDSRVELQQLLASMPKARFTVDLDGFHAHPVPEPAEVSSRVQDTTVILHCGVKRSNRSMDDDVWTSSPGGSSPARRAADTAQTVDVMRPALMLAARRSGNAQLMYLGSAQLAVDCRVGSVNLLFPFEAVSHATHVAESLQFGMTASERIVSVLFPTASPIPAVVEPLQPQVAPIVPSDVDAAGANSPDTEPSETVNTSTVHFGELHGDGDDAQDTTVQAKSFVGWEKLFQPLQGQLGAFSEFPGVVSLLCSAHSGGGDAFGPPNCLKSLLHVCVMFSCCHFSTMPQY